METTHLPKVSKILSSKPVSEAAALQAVARFLEKEQKRLDPVAIQKASHYGDVYLVCEALASDGQNDDDDDDDNEHSRRLLERLRNGASTMRVPKQEAKRFHPKPDQQSSSPHSFDRRPASLVASSSAGPAADRATTSRSTSVGPVRDLTRNGGPVTVTAAAAAVTQQSPVAANVPSMEVVASEPVVVKREIIVDEQRSSSSIPGAANRHGDEYDERAKRKAEKKSKKEKKRQKRHQDEE